MSTEIVPGSYVVVRAGGETHDRERGPTLALLVELDGGEAVVRRFRGAAVGGWRRRVASQAVSARTLFKAVRVEGWRVCRLATARELAAHAVIDPLPPRAP